MKIVYLISLLAVTTLQAQPKKSINKKWARIGLFTGSIILNAIGDGLYDDGHKLAAKSFKAASIGTLLSVPLLSPTPNKKKAFKYVLTYGLMRFGLFDITYNVSRRLPLNYVGTTSVHDKIIGGQPRLMITMMRLSSIGIAIKLNDQL